MKHYPKKTNAVGSQLIYCGCERTESVDEAKKKIKEMRASNKEKLNIVYVRYNDKILIYKDFHYLVKCNEINSERRAEYEKT
jgi:hypothetical protein